MIRVKNIFGRAFSVIAWTNEHEDLKILGLHKLGEGLVLCEVIFRKYGRGALDELLGARERSWGATEDEDEQLKELVEDVDELVFDQCNCADSDDDDELGFGRLHLCDIVRVELSFMFRKEYWSRLWIIQELTVSPTTSTVHWGESVFYLSTLQAVGDILVTHSESRQSWRS
jgi:hypothetical protein